MNPAQANRIARFGLYQADLDRGVLTKDGLRVKLQPQPFRLLALLLDRPGELISRDEIRQQLWSVDTFVEFDDGLNNAIKKLRIALCETADNPRFIETVPREGYRFIAPVIFPAPLVAEETPAAKTSLDQPVMRPLAEPAPAPWFFPLLVSAGIAFLLIAIFAWRDLSSPRSVAITSASQFLGDQTRSRTVDPRAYEEYLKGQQFFRERTSESLAKAVEHFTLAIERDPNFAEAHTGLADCYIVMPMLSNVPQDSTFPKARQAAEQALALDDSLSAAHLAVAEIKLYQDWDFPGAEKEFKRALALNINDAQAHQWYAEFLSLMGRHNEAYQEIQSALKLDPSSVIIHHQAGQVLQAARRYPEALEQYGQALQVQPGFVPSYTSMSTAYRRMGKYLECLETARQVGNYWVPSETTDRQLRNEAHAYAASGPRGLYRLVLKYNQSHRPRAYNLAWNYALLGDNEQALEWLNQSFAAHEGEILNLQNDPEFDHLRSDPRFQEVVRKVGLAPTKDAAESLAKR